MLSPAARRPPEIAVRPVTFQALLPSPAFQFTLASASQSALRRGRSVERNKLYITILFPSVRIVSLIFNEIYNYYTKIIASKGTAATNFPLKRRRAGPLMLKPSAHKRGTAPPAGGEVRLSFPFPRCAANEKRRTPALRCRF